MLNYLNAVSFYNRILAIACDPNWNEKSKQVAVLGEDKFVWIWDLVQKAVTKGHNVHVDKTKIEDKGFSLCYTIDHKVLTYDNKQFVEYCEASNTYKIYADKPLMNRNNNVIMLSASPYDANIFAAGSKTGLVMVYKLKSKFQYY